MRSSSGGWVLNSEVSVPPPNIGLTMHSEEVLGEMAEVGMRRLYVPNFSKAADQAIRLTRHASPGLIRGILARS